MVIAVDQKPGISSGAAIPYPNSIRDKMTIAYVYEAAGISMHSFDHEVQHKNNTTHYYTEQRIHYTHYILQCDTA